MRVAIATCSAVPAQFTDDQRLAEALAQRGAQVSRRAWDDGSTDWRAFDGVIIRSTWDYTAQRRAFLDWADALGMRLHNRADVVRWNSDKHYLADLQGVVPVVPTTYLEPGDPFPRLAGDIVVKPTVSAGARNTGRFGEDTRGEAARLADRIHALGRTVMVQPYQSFVDTRGETAIVCLDGEPSHALRKGPVLRPDEVAPVRDDAIGAAEVMYDPALVVASEASDAELGLARQVLAYVGSRFGEPPLYARVDMVAGPTGEPTLMELELIEPNLYLDQAPSAVQPFATAILERFL